VRARERNDWPNGSGSTRVHPGSVEAGEEAAVTRSNERWSSPDGLASGSLPVG
jgi:hypothetical protein